MSATINGTPSIHQLYDNVGNPAGPSSIVAYFAEKCPLVGASIR